jgi:molecular chaperone GrpE
MSDEQRNEDSGEDFSPESDVVSEAEEILAEAEIEEDLDELEIMTRERNELRELAQRLQADFENFRKRSQRQAEDNAARQAGSVVEALLPVLDALDLAQAHLVEADEISADGQVVLQTRSLLLDAMVKQGLEVIAESGAVFDPTVHEAVIHVADEDGTLEAPVVDEVMRAGYAWRGSVIRPAMVRVKG